MDDVGILPARHKLTVHDYHKLGDAGVLTDDDRVELIDGDLIDMAPIGQGHAAVVGGLTQALVLACVGRALVWCQNPIRLDLLNEPVPDFAVLRARADLYASGERPSPADVLLLVEVSDSSLRFDRTVKLPLYARSGIAELWIVDLKRRTLEAYRNPSASEYRDVTTHGPGDQLALAVAPEIVVRLALAFG